MEFWILILVALFATNSLDKAESIQLEEIDEIFGEGWWDNDKAEEWHKLTLEQNIHHQIDRQNTQLGQIEPNSTDQNPSLTESDYSSNAKNGEERNEIISNENIAEDERKRNIIDKFHTMRNEFKQKGKFSAKEWTQIEKKISKYLNVNRIKIFKWKKELGLTQRNPKNERKILIQKFDQRKGELMRAGLKNTYPNQINETVAKELGLSFITIYKWKRELGQTTPNHKYSHSEQKEIMKRYYEINGKNPKISVGGIAKRLNIGITTLYIWKKQFKREQFFPNFVDGQSLEENATANVQNENSFTAPQHKYSNSEKKELMKSYYEIKDQKPKISVGDIAKRLNIGITTLYIWKKQFKREQFFPNFVDGQSLEENATANV